MTIIGKKFEFEAAHVLPNHEGKCSRLHGHNYVVEVRLSGTPAPVRGKSDDGMVLDFGVLTDIWKRHLEEVLDHQLLNDRLSEAYQPPTAENIAAYIYDAFWLGLRHGTGIVLVEERELALRVRVWETANCWAEYGDD